MINRVFVASSPFGGTCRGVSTEMMDIEGMAVSSYKLSFWMVGRCVLGCDMRSEARLIVATTLT